jgi:4'-phosphopantetheinyl transferase EntD
MNLVSTPWGDRALVIRGTSAEVDVNDWLTAGEIAALDRFRLAKRRDEWIASRVALKRLARERGICDEPLRCTFERPHLLVDGRRTGWIASISHSGDFSGAVIAREPVGIDVQVVRPIAEWSSHLFLSDAETGQMQHCTIADRVLHFWCAKEAAWKQRSDEFATMKQMPLTFVESRERGLVFDRVETYRVAELIVAVTTLQS